MVDGSVRHGEPSDTMCQTASVRPTEVVSLAVANCSGHIDPRVERYRDKAVGVFKLMAILVHFLAMSEIARIRLIWKNWRQIFHRRI